MNKENKTKIFEESPSVNSSTRWLAFMCLIILCLIDFYYLDSAKSNDRLIESMNIYFVFFNFVWLIAIFTPKFLHKLAEIGKFKHK